MVCSAFLSQASTPTLQTPTTPLKSFPWSPVHLTISSIDSQWLVKHQQVLILFPPLFPSPTFENWYPKSFGMTLFTYTFPITHSSTSSCFVTEVLTSCGTVLWYSAQKWTRGFSLCPVMLSLIQAAHARALTALGKSLASCRSLCQH